MASRNAPASSLAPVFRDLSSGQSRGWECIVCRANLLSVAEEEVPDSVVVGRAWSTDQDVRACERSCAPMVGYSQPSGGEQLGLL